MGDLCCEFRVGDRVMCRDDTNTNNGYIPAGALGTVQTIDMNGKRVGVFWDEDVGGHSLFTSNPCEKGHGWFFFDDIYRQPFINLLELTEETSFTESDEMSDFLKNLLNK